MFPVLGGNMLQEGSLCNEILVFKYHILSSHCALTSGGLSDSTVTISDLTFSRLLCQNTVSVSTSGKVSICTKVVFMVSESDTVKLEMFAND